MSSTSFYLNQANIDKASLIVRLMGQKAMTLDQINNLLSANGVENIDIDYLISASRRGWLIRQPNSLYQVDLNMNVKNNLNSLISSNAESVITPTWQHALPVSYLQGGGLLYSPYLTKNSKGQVFYYGVQVLPGSPSINKDLIP